MNGVLKQNDSTADMAVLDPEPLAAASRVGMLEPGDVILMGPRLESAP